MVSQMASEISRDKSYNTSREGIKTKVLLGRTPMMPSNSSGFNQDYNLYLNSSRQLNSNSNNLEKVKLLFRVSKMTRPRMLKVDSKRINNRMRLLQIRINLLLRSTKRCHLMYE